MSSRRLLKAAEAIREVVSMAILAELRDPRVKNVTVTGVEVSPDMREAKISVSIMGNENQQKLSLRGLSNSAGFLQAKIAERIDTRYTPRLSFVIDDGVKKSLAVAEILSKIAAERAQAASNNPPVEDEEDDVDSDVESEDSDDDDDDDDDDQFDEDDDDSEGQDDDDDDEDRDEDDDDNESPSNMTRD